MRKLLALSAAMCLLPAAVMAQSPGELLGSAATQISSDLFECRRGTAPCNLRVRTYNELDPTDFYGSANPVDGYPRYRGVLDNYSADVQITGNYPSGFNKLDLNWYAIWDGVTNPDRFDHVGYYGAQSQVVTYGEIGNPASPTCLPVVAQLACFMALTSSTGHDARGFGPAGSAPREGGLSPIPRPEIVSTSSSSIDFAWDEAANFTMNDGAPSPILGYKLYFMPGGFLDRVGPTEPELNAALIAGSLIDATPGTFIDVSTTSHVLSSTDPVLASFNPATDSLVAVIRLVYAHDVRSEHFSANSFPATFTDLTTRVTDFRARLQRNEVVVNWTVDGLAGVESFNVLRSDQSSGSFYPIDRQDLLVDGARATFTTVDRLFIRNRGRGGAVSFFYRLEVNGLDGTRLLLEPVEVNVRPARRGRGAH